MNRNVEVKARARDLIAVQKMLEQGGAKGKLLHQHDTFYRCPDGRLKLRVFAEGHGELIFYRRPDHTTAKLSQYWIYPTTDAHGLHEILAQCYGVLGEVIKQRLVFIIGQTRIHLDQVETLGDFLELEVVLKPEQPESDGERIAKEWMIRLAIRPEDLLSVAYIDLLTNRV
ncbi:MAG: class IV adenylate cyclase [bacterium]|nr:class IV adenylate cyclase [bacterium]